jgi:hypothetical protein
MKIVKTASGKNRIKMSKSEWTSIGKKAGWIKTATMDVMVSGFDYPQKREDLLDLSHVVEHNLREELKNIIGEDNYKNFIKEKAHYFLTPDGDDEFNRTGIMNLYTRGIPERYLPTICSLIKYLLTDIDGVIVGDISKIEPSGMLDSDVIRIEIKENNYSPIKNVPPELNMANRNAHTIMQLLNFSMSGAGGCFDAWQVISRIDRLIDSQKEEFVIEPRSEGNYYEGGIDIQYIEDRVEKLRDIAQWAIDNGYKKICVR